LGAVLFPGSPVPLRSTSTKIWVSKVKGVESKGTCWKPGMTWSERATVCDASSAMTSSGVKSPPSAMRARISSTLFCGSGMSPSMAGAVALGRPAMNSRRGAPGQLLTATAPANWIMSPAVMPLWLATKGVRAPTLSLMPAFAKKLGSTLGKMIMEPSAPPPAAGPWAFENAMASSLMNVISQGRLVLGMGAHGR
jgi:hypothetical protein